MGTTALYAAGMNVGQQVATHIDYPQSGDAAYAAALKRSVSYMKALNFDGTIQSMPYNDITLAQVNIARARELR